MAKLLRRAEMVGGPEDGCRLQGMPREFTNVVKVFTKAYPGFSYHLYRLVVRPDKTMVYEYEGVRK